MVIPAIIGGGAALVGGALNYFGAKDANKMNQKMAQEQMTYQTGSAEKAMQFGRESAHEQMAFQERMSNTAYQRAVADMQAAGLNPMLAYQQGASSAPSGSSAQGVSQSGSRADVRNRYSSAVSSALQALQLSAQIQQTSAATELMKAELPEKKASAVVYESGVGSILKWAESILKPLKFFK